MARGDLAGERQLLVEAVRGAELEQGTQSPVLFTGLVRLALVALRQGDIQAAVTACAQSLAFQRLCGL